MSARKTVLRALALCGALAALLPATASAQAAPAWTLTLTPMPANFAPGASPHPEYMAVVTNVGAAPSTGPVVLSATLPAGLEPIGVSGVHEPLHGKAKSLSCGIASQVVSCETTDAITPGRWLFAQIQVEPAAAAEGTTLSTEATISGGGAQAVSVATPTKIQKEAVPFEFLPGFHAPANEEDGSPTTLAGSHPYQQTIAFGVPTVNPGDLLTNDGHPRNFYVELPRGMMGTPAASNVLCTEAKLSTLGGCPDASQVGLADITTLVGSTGGNVVFTSPLYNMVPPPGAAAELATNIANQGIYAHIQIGVRSDGDYGIEAATHDVLALGIQPIFNVQAQVWGNPSASAHDSIRGACESDPTTCPVADHNVALLTMPGDCSGQPLPFEVFADSWEKPSPPNEEQSAFYESADLPGSPVALEGCEGLRFEPTLAVRPTTNLTDSPSGLDVDLHQPQDVSADSRSTAALRDAQIRFPKGMTVNPSQATGLAACSEAQVGFQAAGQGGQLFFSKAPQSCPDAAKLGSFEVTSPALVKRNANHEVERDPESKEIVLSPLHGSIYLAQPFANPFGSLIATYLVIEDKQTGIIAKLGGEGELNHQDGQITVSFTENPELPIEDIRAHIFGGARGALITPPGCSPSTTEAKLTPWSAPDATLATSSFEPAVTPLGGACPASEAQMPNAPKLSAGTENPSAGKYSPLLFKLSREDGTQRIGKVEVTAPEGLIGKLAGVGICSDAEIAKARSREAPQKGAEEQADPSCPTASEIGSATAGAGAGPTPFYTHGHVYLAGPYEGAPASMVAITPAIAGPFDLGTVVIRAPIYVDPATAQVRVVSDPIPAILEGVPIDLRSVAVRLDRPNFTLNPTSCAPKSFAANAVSTLGTSAALGQRFQLGGCKSLPYKPKLSARLFGPIHRGGHPRLKSVFAAKPGEANTKAISFTFPKSEFIDQAHFRTICTRVQFAASACPAGSIYGSARVVSPLVDYPLEGPVYLRSSSHKLPDVVLALHGPAYQPIFLEADARVDSVKGGLRARFEFVPDAPLSKAVIDMQGGKKGLFQNSTNICKGTHRASVLLDAQNGKTHDTMPALKAQCGGAKPKKKAKGGGR